MPWQIHVIPPPRGQPYLNKSEPRRFPDVGRNGGHLTPRVFEEFVFLQQKYGDSQALKSIALEHYTVDAILKIVQDHNLTDEIYLDALGRIKIFITEREILEAKANLHAAGEVGVDLSKTEWINEHDMNEVCAIDFPEELVWIWCTP